MRTDFLSRLSHEVRSPLGVIMGVLGELDASMDESDPNRHLLALADRGIARLKNLADALMEVSELESVGPEGLSLEREDVDLRDVIGAAVEHTRAVESRSDVEIGTSVPDTAVTASVDAHKIERVVSVLLSNAVRFGHHRASVALSAEDGEVEIRVEDDGPGIPPAIRDDVFRRFVGEHLEGRKGGVAFGLSIAQDYVSAHGGRIMIEGARPEDMGDRPGTRVCVHIPGRAGP